MPRSSRSQTCMLAAAPDQAADDAARRGAGMAAFHCYNSAALASLDSYLRLDAAHGMESVAVVWGGAPLPAPWVSRINVDWVSACRECMWFLDCANCSLPGACMPQSLPRLRAGRARRRRRVSGQLAGCVREQLVPRVQHSSHPHSPAACAWGVSLTRTLRRGPARAQRRSSSATPSARAAWWAPTPGCSRAACRATTPCPRLPTLQRSWRAAARRPSWRPAAQRPTAPRWSTAASPTSSSGMRREREILQQLPSSP